MTSSASSFETNLVRHALKRCRQAFYLLTLTSMVINVLMLLQSIYILQVFTRVLPGRGYETLLYLTLAVIVSYFVLSLLMWVRSGILMAISRWLTDQLAPLSLMRGPDQLMIGNNYGTQALKDINQVASFMGSKGMISIIDLPWIIIYVVVIMFLHVYLGAITIVGALILILLAWINERVTKEQYQTSNLQLVRNQMVIDAAIRNAESIQAMGMMGYILDTWQKAEQSTRKMLSQAQMKTFFIENTAHFFRLSIQVLIIAVGAYLVLINQLTSGGMIAASILMTRALSPLEGVISSWQQFMQCRIAYNRISNYLKGPGRPESTFPYKPQGFIRVQEMHYMDPVSKKMILENLSFQVLPGEVMGIIGPSGSGKTTLARLLMGVYPPSKGSVRLDDAQVYLWDRKEFGEHVGYLPQSIELFNGSVAENIARMQKEKKEGAIAAAQLAGVHQMILHLPGGYESEIGMGGAALSGGMRQRLALARAVYGNPSILVLDEPNSNLDDEGVIALLNCIRTLKERKKSIILITHQRNLLQVTDKLLFLREGRQVMFGKTKDVLDKLNQEFQKAALASQHAKQQQS